MKKAAWDAMDALEKECLILAALWKAENGKAIDIRRNEFGAGYIPSGKPWKAHAIDADAVSVPRYTTDRNACALVLDEIEQRGLEVGFLSAFSDQAKDFMKETGECVSMWLALRASPDTICYAALKAVEDE